MHLDHAARRHRGLLLIILIRGKGQRAAIVQRRADARTPVCLPATTRVAHARGVRRAAERERARLCRLPSRQERGGDAGRQDGGSDERA